VAVHAFGGDARISGDGANGDQIGAGGRVQASPDGRVLLAFTTGTRVSLEPSGDLTLVENGSAQVLALNHGALRADVAKLAPGRRFLVQTADAEVEVHGTSFRVSTEPAAVGCGKRTLTRVQVFEGVVTVRSGGSEHRIERGDQWRTACSEAASPAAAPDAGAPSGASPADSTESTRPRGAASRVNSPVPRAQAPSALLAHSDLTGQNDAFAAAIAAKRSGDLARAVRGFDLLLARSPDGPLAESAAVQRLKLTHRFDQPRALELAREYLRRYPSGFAREQALAILSEPR
jgi:hypothetical protein